MSQPATPIEAAADVLVRVTVAGDRQRFAVKLAAFKGRLFMDPGQPGASNALDLAGLVADLRIPTKPVEDYDFERGDADDL